MERVMAELSAQFARDKLGPDTDKAVLRERVRAEARSPTRDAIAVRCPCTWALGLGFEKPCTHACAESHRGLFLVKCSPVRDAIVMWAPVPGCSMGWHTKILHNARQ